MSEIIFNPRAAVSEVDLRSQIENLQTTLASLNQQVIILQEAVQERDQEISDLQAASKASPCEAEVEKTDQTLTIVGALINLYKFILPQRAT